VHYPGDSEDVNDLYTLQRIIKGGMLGFGVWKFGGWNTQ